MTYSDFQTKVWERRTVTGEGYSVAAKALIKYLRESGQLSEEQARDFEGRAKYGH